MIRLLMVTLFVTGLAVAGKSQSSEPRAQMNRDLKFSGLCGSGAAYGKGYEITWNGIPAPASYTASQGGSYMICITVNLSHNPLTKGASPEFLKYITVNAGSCWTGFRNFSPSGSGSAYMTGDLGNGTGEWIAEQKEHSLSWQFHHPENGNHSGDGDVLASGYRCVQYSFCFTADINPACDDVNGLSIEAFLEGDGKDKGILPYNSALACASKTRNNLSNSASATISRISSESVASGMVSLNWNYLNAFAPAEFIIEHSEDGAMFTEVIRVNANDASSGGENYNFMFQEELSGRLFYRVRVPNTGNEQVISPTTEMHIKSENQFALQYLKPNPASEYAEIAFTSPNEGYSELQVQDMNGRIVHSESLFAQNGINHVSLSIDSWKPGIYILYIQKGKETLSSKLVKQ